MTTTSTRETAEIGTAVNLDATTVIDLPAVTTPADTLDEDLQHLEEAARKLSETHALINSKCSGILGAPWYAKTGVPQRILILSTALAKAVGAAAPQIGPRTRIEPVPPTTNRVAQLVEKTVDRGMYMDCALERGRTPEELTHFIASEIERLGL